MIVRQNATGDIELMAEVSAGSVKAFGRLYDRYGERAYRVAFSVCRNDGYAQEAVQDAFLGVWKSRASYRSQQGTVAAWILTMARYRAIDTVRRNGKHDARRAGEEQLERRTSADDVSQTAIDRDTADQLQASLALLPEAQQEVIALAFYGQLSHTEIANQLGLAAGTVKGRMRLGLQKLRATIEQAA